ncbi:unnamed protein product [Cuscuta campestris]|uniref:Uncharacterized protein n=1 Tax=Cuscuta campestris TaxID=132261 RepID=A0A484LTQ7_9ASTE|nr:unnamed protein product [Cuscuta campestris]
MGKDKSRVGPSGKSKSKSRAPTTTSDERFYYEDGSYLWFDSKEERTRFLTFFSKRVVAPPRILPERLPEMLRYDFLDAQLHQSGLWPFVSKARKEINLALIRVFYSNLRHEDDVIYSLVKGRRLRAQQRGPSPQRARHHQPHLPRHGPPHHPLRDPPESCLLLYIVSRILKPRKHGHTIMSGEDLKLLHAIMHSAPINRAKFVMIYMTDATCIAHDHLLPYPFLVMDILERFKVTTTVGPLTKATKIWTISDQTFKKRLDNATPATSARCRPATSARRRPATGPAEPQARCNLASIADSLNRLNLKVGGMGGYLERLDEAIQHQGYAMNAYFQRVSYVPPPY